MKLTRPLVLLLLAALSPLVILCAGIGGGALKHQQTAMREQATAHTRLAATLVQRALEGEVAVVSSIAGSPRFDTPSAEAFVAYFDEFRRGQPQWRRVTLASPEGVLLAQSPKGGAAPVQPVDQASLAAAIATGQPVVGSLIADGLGRIGIPVRAPIVRNGRVEGVISAIVDQAAVARALNTDSLPRGWRAAVLDRAGRVVAIGGRVPIRPMSGSAEALAARQRASSGLYEGQLPSGQRTLTAYQVLPRYGWSVHVLIPLEMYRAPTQRAVWLVAICSGLGLALVAVFLILLGREMRLRRRQETAAEQLRRMEALGRMTGGVAHDFNNLLMIVQGSAEMLKRRPGEPDRTAKLAEAILSAAQRGQALTRQLLAFARRGAHEPVAFALQDRAEDISQLLARAAGDAVGVEVSIPPDLWPVFADPNGLEMALINLAVNARDAMPDGGQLSVAASNATLQPGRGDGLALDGEFVAIAVRDTGAGIAEDHLAHIFEPFFTTKGAGKGTGLGLSQVYGFTKQSGGAVTVASRPGQGAAFTLYLPRASGQLADSPFEAPREPDGRGRLLVVDDEPEVCEAVAAMMEAQGYAVVCAGDAGEALALLDQGLAVDAVLADVVMPGGSGLELAARLRTSRPRLPVVLMTGFSDALADGGACPWPVLSKPFTPAEAAAALGLAGRQAA